MKLWLILPVIVFSALAYAFGYQAAYRDLESQLAQTARMGYAEHKNFKQALDAAMRCEADKANLKVQFSRSMRGEQFTYYPLQGEKLKAVK